MAAVKGKGRRTTLAVAAERAGISADYYQELQDTFKLYDTDSTGTLSVRKLRLAMRTLGFEASAKDIDQIIQETSMLSVHSRRRKQAEQQSKRERSLANGQDQSKSKGRPQRKSTRATAIAAALDSQSKYVELDSEGEDKEGLGGDDSDPNDDFYKDTGARERQHPSVDDDLYFTFDDFVLIMAPNEVSSGIFTRTISNIVDVHILIFFIVY